MIYEKVDRIANQRGILKKALADAMGVSPSKLTLWSNRQWKPTVYHVLKLARFLEVPMEYLVDDKMTELPPATAPAEALSREERLLLMTGQEIGCQEAIRRIYAEATLRQLLREVSKRLTVEIRESVAAGAYNGNRPEAEASRTETSEVRVEPPPLPPDYPGDRTSPPRDKTAGGRQSPSEQKPVVTRD